ncbi:hypothetical protein KSS87_007257 [Heliosperma pusillum]|nr:hypothetical protein KSS87_007257 [Heliosperma pusillum]
MWDFLICWSSSQRIRFLRCRGFISNDGRFRRLVYRINFLRSFRKSGSTPCHCFSAAHVRRCSQEIKRGFEADTSDRGHMSDTPEIMKQMPPLPVKLNDELANTILPRLSHRNQS